MAQYCPLPGQYLAVVRQDSLCREGVLKISATASFSCVSSATLAFTLHSSRFGCKLLIFNEYCGWRVGADSSPLFTLTFFEGEIISGTTFGLQWWPAPVFNDDLLLSSMMTSFRLQWWPASGFNDGWAYCDKVKRGEERWRVVKSEAWLFTFLMYW